MVSNVDEANAVAQVFLNTNMVLPEELLVLLSLKFYLEKLICLALNGALAGLVSITAEPLAPTALLATIIGVVGGVIVVFSILFFDKED